MQKSLSRQTLLSKSKSAFAQKSVSKLASLQKSLSLLKQKSRQDFSPLQKSNLKFQQKLVQAQILLNKQKARQKGRQVQRKSKLTSKRGVNDFFGGKGRPLGGGGFPPLKSSGILKRKIGLIVKKKAEFRGWNVLGKPLKQKRFVKLNLNSLTKAKAKDLGAWLTDHSLGRTFKLKGTMSIAKKPKLKVPGSYYSKTRGKFRGFRISKGKKIKLRDSYIEKKGKYLLDTRSEKKKITLLAQRARLRKKYLKQTKLGRIKL